jgi:uncharacterized protein (DUF305 family)
MKSTVLFASIGMCSLLLAGCNGEKPAEKSAAVESAAGTGMDHSGSMSHAGEAVASPQQAAMNEMMGQMDAVTMSGNTDLDFARMMLAHHRGAVFMADLELRNGKNAAMRQLATTIKADQQVEIGELKQSIYRLRSAPANYQPRNPSDPFTSKMKASMDDMMNDTPPVGADADSSFNRLMTLHHQSAVAMARAELTHGRDAKLQELARKIIVAQEKEIQQLVDWRTRNAGTSKASTMRYECPMHCAGSESAQPGKCPTCAMDLVKKA